MNTDKNNKRYCCIITCWCVFMSFPLRSPSQTTPPPPPHWLTVFLQEETKWKRVWWQMWVHILTLTQDARTDFFLIRRDHTSEPYSCYSLALFKDCIGNFFGVFQVALPHSLPLPRRETLQQSSSLSTVSPATVDLTLKVNRQTATLLSLRKTSFQWYMT